MPRWRGCACSARAPFRCCSPFVTSGAAAAARAAALAALEGSDDARTVAVARQALAGADAALALAAVGVLRGWLAHEQGTEALEALTVVALDRERDGAVRLAALDALSDLPAHLVAPIRATSALETRRTAAPPTPARRWSGWPRRARPRRWPGCTTRCRRPARRSGRATDARRDDWRRVRGAAHVRAGAPRIAPGALRSARRVRRRHARRCRSTS